ncbi:MAG: DUF4350 domain-containing protein [Polyangiaceae bacterium]
MTALPRRGMAAWTAWTAVLTFCILLLARPLPAVAAPHAFDPADEGWEGLSELARIAKTELDERRVVLTTRLDYTNLKKEDGVLIVHPTRAMNVDALSNFMHAGGRVVLLDDYGTGDALLRHFGLERVPLPKDPHRSLRRNPSLVIAEPASQHPVVHDVGNVVVNHGTGLRHDELSPVLLVRSKSGGETMLALAGAVGQGRLLAVGDGSLVINGMLRYRGNRSFANAICKYAVDDDAWGKRRGRLFVVSEDFTETGSFGDDPADKGPLDDKLRAIEDALRSLAREGLSPTAAYVLAIAFGLSLVVWVGTRAGKLHKVVSPRFVRPVPLVAQGGVAGHAAVVGGALARRELAMLELKSALEEDLAGLVGETAVPGAQVLLEKVESHGLLSVDDRRTLRALLLRMAEVETMVTRDARANDDRTFRIKDDEVVETAATVRALLDRAHASAATRRGSVRPPPWAVGGGARG